jgi:parallel beta-helix repeat protein
MKKVVIMIIVCILFLSAFSVFLPVGTCEVINGKTLYVGGSRPENYAKIQDAIDNASDGDTVFVYNGTYFENIVIDKTISLIGENKNGTIIDGNGVGDVVYISVTIGIFSGFTIQNSGDDRYSKLKCNAGMKIDSNGSFNIIGNNIVHNFFGIISYNTYSIKIAGNIISNNAYGIYLSNSSINNISKNIITNDYDGISYHGIRLVQTDNTIVASNTISNSYYGDGINLQSVDNTLVINNTISNNHDGIAIYFPSNNNTITGNYISHNDHGISTGLHITNLSNNKIIENNFTENNIVFYVYEQDMHLYTINNLLGNNSLFNNNKYFDFYSFPVTPFPFVSEFGLCIIICIIIFFAVTIIVILLWKRKRIS